MERQTATKNKQESINSSSLSRGILQRKCACGNQSAGGGECGECGKKNQLLQRRAIHISEPGDRYEQEADLVAKEIMTMPNPTALSVQQDRVSGEKKETIQTKSLATTITPILQRQPLLGATSVQKNPALQKAKNEDTFEAEAEPNLENRLTNSGSGSPLPDDVRSFMELRFGADFSHVRVHTGSEAVQMNQYLSAQAFTHRQNIYFGAGKAPAQDALTAHELTHVVQQTSAVPQLQRACLPLADCTKPQATLENFVKETENKPENLSKAAKRKKACGGKVPSPACTSDGHGAKATSLTALMEQSYKSRLGHITGIFVDKDIPADFGAVTFSCAGFTPPLKGGTCTFVPDVLEVQAKEYRRGNRLIGGKFREDWLTEALGTLTHETEHARFNAASPINEPSATACKFADHESNLSEMAAHLSEMHVYYRAALARPEKNRFDQFFRMFDFWVKNGSEDISGIVKDLRCKCDCSDADHYITKTAESVSSNQKWDTNELSMIHKELRDTKWGVDLKWPVAPPAQVNPGDVPAATPVPFKLE